MERISWYELKKRTKRAQKVVKNYAAGAGAIVVAPIPGRDSPLLLSQQTAMMRSISEVFSLDINEDVLKELAMSAVEVGAPAAGKAIVTGIKNLLPAGGKAIIGGAISAVTASAITYVIGKAYIELCKMILQGKLDPNDLAFKNGANALTIELKRILKQQKAMPRHRKKNVGGASGGDDRPNHSSRTGHTHKYKKSRNGGDIKNRKT